MLVAKCDDCPCRMMDSEIGYVWCNLDFTTIQTEYSNLNFVYSKDCNLDYIVVSGEQIKPEWINIDIPDTQNCERGE
jgi:hypothetical protein